MKSRFGSILLVVVMSTAGLEAARRGLAHRQLARGVEAKETWQLDDAEKHLSRARWLRPELPEIRLELAECRLTRGDARGAEKALRGVRAVDLDTEASFRLRLARAQLAQFEGRGQEAAEAYRDLLTAPIPGVDAGQQAARRSRVLRGLARILDAQLGQPREAAVYLEEALAVARRADLPEQEAWGLLEMAALARAQGRGTDIRVQRWLEPAREIFERLDHPAGRAAVLMALAGAAGDRRDFAAEVELAAESRRLYEASGHLLGPVALDLRRARRAAGLERYDEALEGYLGCRRRYEALGDRPGARAATLGLAWVKLRTEQLADAKALLDPLLAELGPTSHRRYALLLSGHVALHDGEPEEAVRFYGEVLQLDRSLGRRDPSSVSSLLAMMGQAGLQAGDLDTAGETLAEARRLAGERGDVNSLVAALLSSADLAELQMRLAKVRGEGAPAVEARAARTVAFLEAALELQAGFRGGGVSPFFFTQFWQSLERLRSLLLDHHLGEGVKRRAHAALFRALELMRHRPRAGDALSRRLDPPTSPKVRSALRRVSERLAGGPGDVAALEQAYRRYGEAMVEAQIGSTADLAAERRGPADLGGFQRALPSKAAVVFYAFGDERVFALLVARDAELTVGLPIDRRGLADRIGLLRHLMAETVEAEAQGSEASTDELPAWQPVAAALHEALIDPLYDAGLRPGMDLGVVPIGELHELPFAALLAADGSPLVDRHLLWTAPSAASMLEPGSRRGRDVVALGVEQGVDGPRFVAAVAEAREIAALTGGRAVVGEEATEAALRRSAGAGVLHLAAHGEAEAERPLLSRLAFAADPQAGGDPARDGRLTVDEILALKLESELVVLSSCRASVAYARRADDWASERLGLAGAFLSSGARRVIASQLPVADDGVHRLMLDLYQELGRYPPAVALRRVQRRHWEEEVAALGFSLMGSMPDRDAGAFLSVGGS